ncbi:hypothetical protein CC86DRAFT_300976 [Ophiobolus disseminans]|uniref:L domain-like protein n=1 Tax=Ophiobolus disseminans TaxID=1469910 RepID=A0A6A6ZNZ3_9PLEO|nr:hypothetical protein CC86DRAFT_300976 [Ophiobolus disseminans]
MIDRLTDEVLEKLPARLFSLKKLETTNVSFIDALPNHTLTHLKWVGNIEGVNLSNILNQQGKSLQSLEFRHNELESSIFTSGFDISVLPKMARNLTHVGINIPRNGTWPLESLKTVASLPHLKSADLWMNLQSECRRQKPNGHDRIQRDWEREHGRDVCKDEEQFQQPFVGKEGAEGIFAYMKEHNRVGELEDVTFWVGDWARPWDGPLYFPVWGEGKSSKVECTSAGLKTDDTDGKCVVERGEKYWNWWDEMPQEFYDGMGEWW